MINTDGIWFKDEEGRTLLLRGVNLGGSSKVPTRPDGATYRREGFFEHRHLSFDPHHKTFCLSFRHNPQVSAPTEIFVPQRHYPQGVHIDLSDGVYEELPHEQKLLYRHTTNQLLHQFTLRPPTTAL